MTCPYCGLVNDENDVLCKACGTRFQQTQQTYNVSRNQYYEEMTNNNFSNQQTAQHSVPYPQHQPFQQSLYGQNYNNSYNDYDKTTYGNMYQPVNSNQLSMTFNKLYAIWLLFSAFSNIMTVFSSSMIADSFDYGYIGVFLSLLPIIYLSLTGIFLLKQKKLGYILIKIRNIFNIVSSAIGIVASIVLILVSIINADYFAIEDGTLAPLFIIIGIILLIACAVSIVINTLVIKYYNKRKYLFK